MFISYKSKNCWLLLLIACSLYISCKKTDTTIPAVIKVPDTSIVHIPDTTIVHIITAKTLVILGSSTAEGTGADPVDSSWVNKLKKQLSDDKRNTTVINLAKGGFATYSILPSNYNSADTTRNITKALTYKPDFIIINLPSNDIVAGLTDDQILKNYSIITNQIIAAHINFLITSTQPRNLQSYNDRKRLQLFNPKLETVYSNHVVDYYAQLSTADYYIQPSLSYGDGIHLNNKGHDIIYKSILTDLLFNSFFYK